MKKLIHLFTLAIVSSLAISGCSSTAAISKPTSSTTEKEAGSRGSRICITNKTDIPMTAGAIGAIQPENAKNIVGAPGQLTSSSPLCFAGWNSYKLLAQQSQEASAGEESEVTADVAVGVNVDGNYNLISLRAYNPGLFPASFFWASKNQQKATWDGGFMSEGDSKEVDVEGLTFILTRKDDSDLYEEFTVRFINVDK